MALGFATNLRNAMADAITTFTGGSCVIKIYSGSRPSTGGAEGTVLAQLAGNATFAPSASGGVLTLNSITQDSLANATGTAAWFRIYKTDGTTHVMDGSVGTSGSDLNLNTTSIVANGPVSITSCTITIGNA